MTRTILPVLAGIAAAMLPSTASAAPRNERVLTIFGDEKCPTSNGEEIVVCRRLPLNEKYRIPLDLRSPDDPRAATWAARAKSFEYVGAAGPASCTPTGGGGGIGCFRQMMQQARQEDEARGKEPAVKF